jgi:hypothetical protein
VSTATAIIDQGRRIRGAHIHLRVINAENGESHWEREIERKLSTRFDPKHGPLIRAVLLHQPNKSILIFTAYHPIGDGISAAFAIHDILHAISGEKLEALRPLPYMGDMLGVPQPSPTRPASQSESMDATLGGFNPLSGCLITTSARTRSAATLTAVQTASVPDGMAAVVWHTTFRRPHWLYHIFKLDMRFGWRRRAKPQCV